MDNLDAMITAALSQRHEPEERLIFMTIAALNEDKRHDHALLNLIFVFNILWIVLICAASVVTQYETVRLVCYMFIFIWSSAIIPIYFIARARLRRV